MWGALRTTSFLHRDKKQTAISECWTDDVSKTSRGSSRSTVLANPQLCDPDFPAQAQAFGALHPPLKVPMTAGTTVQIQCRQAWPYSHIGRICIINMTSLNSCSTSIITVPFLFFRVLGKLVLFRAVQYSVRTSAPHFHCSCYPALRSRICNSLWRIGPSNNKAD